ncbi:hypothetical protein N0V87_003489 [Didymella glomerata]|uniref:Uncharacterized protein n=1 Tax=Didymella glomerata TaxID=749621 RepID=A0A9W8X367_9PLEO|nr:hypothetical protein N0V87_003489 [Didymella glomerata]
MPLHRVKSRVRFQGPSKKIKHDDGGNPQYKPTRTVFDAAPQSPLFRNMGEENWFKKKRVPSTEELGGLLKSNLSSSLAAEKAFLEQQRTQYSPPSPVFQHFEHVQGDDDDPPASLLELAPLAYANRDHHEATTEAAVVGEQRHDGEGSSTSSVATTAIYAPRIGHHKQEALPQPSPPTPIGGIRSLFHAYAEEASAVDTCAIEDDDEDDAAWPQSPAPIPIRKGQSAFLKRVVTLFAGRRRVRVNDKGLNEQTKDHEESTTPLNSPPQPSVGSPYCSVFSDDATSASSVPSRPIRRPPPRQGPSNFGRGNSRLNLPVSPPVVVPKGQRPHQPFDEGLSQPFIKPAPDHKLFGTYYVAPDIFTPEVVQQGFPGPSTLTTLTHPLPNEARFLDRTNTAWGKWYAKYPKPEDLPFAAAYKGAQESTDQEVWHVHAAAHARFRKTAPPPMSEEEMWQRLHEEEHERAERLRYHTDHCFRALTEFCYPWQGGLIL